MGEGYEKGRVEKYNLPEKTEILLSNLLLFPASADANKKDLDHKGKNNKRKGRKIDE